MENRFTSNNFAGICYTNYGWIINCSSDFSAEGEGIAPHFSGICWHNKGVVSNCDARGEFSVECQGYLGGISIYNNDFSLNDGTTSSGLISNCRNYVNFEMTGTDYSGACIGGMVAFSQGRIERCVNFGTIKAEFSPGYGYTFGSIAGQGWQEPGMDVIDCLNYGEITIDCTEQGFPSDYYKSGMVGYAYAGSVRNMISLEKTKYVKETETKEYGDVIGTNNMSEAYNCYAVSEPNDVWTQKETSFTKAIESLNQRTGKDGYWILDEKGQPALREMILDTHITIGRIRDFGANYINVPWFGGGNNISECKLLWRKVGDNNWNEIYGVNNHVNNTVISGLKPKSIYEIKIVAQSENGEIIISEIDSVATMFEPTNFDYEAYTINDYADLKAFALMISHGENFINKKVSIAHDIDMRGLKGELWEPMRSKYSLDFFQGELDGQGHVLYDMRVDTRKCYAGLFALMSGTIHDLTIRDAEIICSPASMIESGNYSFSGSGETGGVGGFIGSGVKSYKPNKPNYNADYDYIVERCGFEGAISGGYCIGGLVGDQGLRIINSYAHAKIFANDIANDKTSYSISGISNMEVQNCYFSGRINSKKPVKWAGGVSAGVYLVENSYYNRDALESVVAESHGRGLPIDSNLMREKSFAVKLNPSSPEIWTFVEGVNDGYPVLAECNKPRVTTESAKCEEDGQITLKALAFEGGSGAYAEKGFQYLSNTTNQQVVYDVKAEKEDGIRFETYVDNKAVPSIGINYRAYAIYEEGDTIFGDWEEFVPSIVLPKLNLIAVNYAEGKGYVSYTIEVGTEHVAKFELVTVTDKDNRFVQDLDYRETKGTITLPSYDDFPLATFIECTMTNGNTIASDSIIWGPYGIEGDANADFRLTVADVTTTLNYILDIYPRHFSKENTDVNKDGNITVTDATIITNMVMGATYKALPDNGSNTDAAQSNLMLLMDDFSIENGVPAEMGIRMNNAEDFVAAQFDVSVNGGIKIVDAKVDDMHDVAWKQMEDNRYRIMVYSMGNEHFATENMVYLTFVVDDGANAGDVRLDNIFVDSVNGNEINEIMLKPNNARYTTNNTTVVEDLGIDKSQNNVYYNLNGQRVMTPHKGVYIVNGNKVSL